jgi:hypothetical protein
MSGSGLLPCNIACKAEFRPLVKFDLAGMVSRGTLVKFEDEDTPVAPFSASAGATRVPKGAAIKLLIFGEQHLGGAAQDRSRQTKPGIGYAG